MSKKTLYHSELSKLGIINARINSEPTPSKFPDKPKWVVIEIGGEERYYNCENEECELALTGFRDEWVELEAHGSREEAAIRIERIDTLQPSATKEQIAAAKAKIAAMPDEPADEKPAKATTVADEKPRIADRAAGERFRDPIEHQPELVRDTEGGKLRGYAAHAGKIFGLAWEESKNAMALIPPKDATELSVAEWLDLRLRIAQGYAIEINKIIRKERF